MGTNFYVNEKHIGKRSGAGEYCNKCEITLCKDGKEGVHRRRSKWHQECPICCDRKYVGCVTSFTWAIDPLKFHHMTQPVIMDEYGHKFTYDDFVELIKESKIHFYDMIGREFS